MRTGQQRRRAAIAANAESVAAEDAALNFQRAYGNSSRIGDYLVQGKVAPASVVAVPARSDQLFTLAAGLGFVPGRRR